MIVIDHFNFKIPVGKNGDCYDRYLCQNRRNERKYFYY